MLFNTHYVIKKIKKSPFGIFVNYAPLIDGFNAGEISFCISDFDIKGITQGSNDFIYETNAKHILNSEYFSVASANL